MLLDSVIVIDALNRIEAAIEFLRRARSRARVSPIDDATTELAVELRRSYRWKLPDAFQTALAVQHEIALVTRNTKDLDPKTHAFVLVPYSLSS